MWTSSGQRCNLVLDGPYVGPGLTATGGQVVANERGDANVYKICCVLMMVGLAVGCTTTQKGAGAGTAVGAGVGAIIGHQSGHRTKGAAIGAVVGGVAGAAAGNKAEQKLFCPTCGKQFSGEKGITHCPYDGTELKMVEK